MATGVKAWQLVLFTFAIAAAMGAQTMVRSGQLTGVATAGFIAGGTPFEPVTGRLIRRSR